MDLSRRHVVTLIAGSIGLAPLVAAWRGRPSGVAPVARAGATPPVARSGSAAVPSRKPVGTRPTATIEVIGREGWSNHPQGLFRSHTIERITIHHTAVELLDDSDAPARLRRHQNWHVSQGWPDLAYHFVIDRAGNTYEGRPIEAVGDTSTEYDPTGHLLVCCEGDFDRQIPSRAQTASLTGLVGWAMDSFFIPARRVAGHNEWADTTCPGTELSSRLAGAIRSASAQPPTTLHYLRGKRAHARVARIAAG